MKTSTSRRPDPDTFETFYKDVRGRLLLQTWALTGDLPAAQKAVRDALVVGWHHWRKVSLLDDPESYVRPVAWSRAQRRATARPFHRERGFDEGIRATLSALHKLPLLQRRVLLLAHLTTLPLDQLAREVGVPQVKAEAELQRATAAFALERGVAATAILRLFEPMAAELREIRWPRTTILTRAGNGRRRLHTGIGVAVAIGAFLGSGMVATDAEGSRPALDNLALHTRTQITHRTTYPLRTDDLLSEGIVSNELSGQWSTELTSDNTPGNGLVLPCQRQRFADRNARAALMRTLTSGDDRSVGQATEVSTTPQAAHAAWQASLTWYAGCSEPRVQLMSTRSVTGVGDEATLVVLRDWSDPQRSIVAGVARTGIITTTVVTAAPASAPRAVTDNTDLLGLAVTKLCALPQAGTCASEATNTAIAPLPIGKTPAMLNTVDLPPVAGVTQTWDATDAVAATTNTAATRCDNASFHGGGVKGGLTRSFVVPDATNLPPQFGLTETIGTLPTAKAAAAFVAGVRTKISGCPKKDLGTTIDPLDSVATKTGEITAWRVHVDISDKSSVIFLMAIIRTGAHVAQIGFVPDGAHTIADGDFVELAHRAADRLAVLG
ncbi:hypothetical protein [Nocardioides sp. Kera G14]|uniref:hypothetical protein n=1 Tax=Nocardioides sp. Kera G14 TaxID=2884264 RepID=UPI001D0FEC70|nr:hypothetical protein [Nocardioides sp. Kera G14]UDY24372.1 hypothetical protein LH076_03450 [Nocardioides sp. Kera G14]